MRESIRYCRNRIPHNPMHAIPVLCVYCVCFLSEAHYRFGLHSDLVPGLVLYASTMLLRCKDEVRNHPKEVNNHAWGGCVYTSYTYIYIYIHMYIYIRTYVYNIYTYRTLLHLHMKKNTHISTESTAIRNLQVPVNVDLDVGFLFADPWNQLCVLLIRLLEV